MATGRRSAQAQAAEARSAHARSRSRRARLHELPQRTPGEAALRSERVNGEIKRRTEVVGIFPNEDAIVRLVGAILLETIDEWAVQRSRYMSLETIAPLSDDGLAALPAIPA